MCLQEGQNTDLVTNTINSRPVKPKGPPLDRSLKENYKKTLILLYRWAWTHHLPGEAG